MSALNEAFSFDQPSACCACASVVNATFAGACLTACGFAIWLDAYDPAVLSSIRAKFLDWYGGAAGDRTDVRRYLPHSARFGIRGRRDMVMVPDHLLSESELKSVLYNRAVTSSHLVHLRGANVTEPPMLNFAAFMQSSSYTKEQDWHKDATFVDDLKVQIPLMDVTPDLGPLEINVTKSSEGCPVVRGIVPLGAAIMYRADQFHRGAAPSSGLADGADRAASRTVMDLSYATAPTVVVDDFVGGKTAYTTQAVEATRSNRRIASELCAADGLECASPDDAHSLKPQRPPFNDPLPDVEEVGWVGTYKGEGDGVGTWVDTDGSVYEGDFRDGLKHGRGKYKYSNGDYYEGEFVDDEPHGVGRYEFATGGASEGQWERGNLNGRAEVTSPSGRHFVGEVEDDLPKRGKLTLPTGVILEGDFVGTVLTGSACKISYPDGRWYEGECRDNLPNGVGRGMGQNGELIYQGNWVGGKPAETSEQPDNDEVKGDEPKHGKRTLFNGVVLEGKFLSDQSEQLLDGPCKITFPNGRLYEGNCRDGLPNGKGQELRENGEVVYDGEWLDGTPANLNHLKARLRDSDAIAREEL